MMEQEHVAERIRKSYPFVNLVFGTHVIHRFPELLHQALVDGKRVFSRGNEEEDAVIVEGLPIYRDGTTKPGLRSCMAAIILFLLCGSLCPRQGKKS